jgi:hypothetical protein
MGAMQIRRAFSSFFRLFEINSELMKLLQMANIDKQTASGEISRCHQPN